MSQTNRDTLSLSVVIPTFNRAYQVEAAIESVLNQVDFLPLEIIILDDASSDNTDDVLNELSAHSPVPLITYKSKINVGPSKLRNLGIEKARGDYVAFLDSDDIWTPNKLKVFNSDLSSNHKISLWTHYQDSQGGNERIISQIEIVPFWKQLLKNHASCSCTIIRKNVHEKFLENMKYNEDHEFFTRVSFSHSLFLNHSILTIRDRELNEKGGLSGNVWKMRLGEMQTYINAASYNRKLILLLPFLLIFSLLKHARLVLRTV